MTTRNMIRGVLVYVICLPMFYNSRAISSMLFTLLWPIIPWLLQLIVFSWFVAVGVYPFIFTQKDRVLCELDYHCVFYRFIAHLYMYFCTGLSLDEI